MHDDSSRRQAQRINFSMGFEYIEHKLLPQLGITYVQLQLWSCTYGHFESTTEVRKVLKTPLFLQRNACGISRPRLPVLYTHILGANARERQDCWECASMVLLLRIPKKNDAGRMLGLLASLFVSMQVEVCCISFFRITETGFLPFPMSALRWTVEAVEKIIIALPALLCY